VLETDRPTSHPQDAREARNDFGFPTTKDYSFYRPERWNRSAYSSLSSPEPRWLKAVIVTVLTGGALVFLTELLWAAVDGRLVIR
jgi:hypothetical protein